MLTTKTRKDGPAIIVTLPKSEEHQIPINKEFIVVYEEQDFITLIPKINDPFSDAETGAFYEVDEWQNFPKDGRELL